MAQVPAGRHLGSDLRAEHHHPRRREHVRRYRACFPIRASSPSASADAVCASVRRHGDCRYIAVRGAWYIRGLQVLQSTGAHFFGIKIHPLGVRSESQRFRPKWRDGIRFLVIVERRKAVPAIPDPRNLRRVL